MSTPDPFSGMPFTREQLEAVVRRAPKQAEPLIQQWVFAAYGGVMLQVQSFEAQLASLKFILTARPTNHTTQKGRQKYFEKRFIQIRHMLQSSSASGILDGIEDELDPELRDEIKYLIGWRNRLAHSYLRQKVIVPKEDGMALNTTLDVALELHAIGNAFTAANERIEAAKTEGLKNLKWTRENKEAELPSAFVETVMMAMAEVLFVKPPAFRPFEPGATEETVEEQDAAD